MAVVVLVVVDPYIYRVLKTCLLASSLFYGRRI